MPGGGWAMRHRCALLVGSVLAAPWQCACTESPAASQCSNEGQEVPVCHEIVNYLNELQSLGFATAVCQGNENCTGFVFESVDGGAPQSMSDMGKLYLLDCAPNPNVTHHSWTNRSFWRCSVHTSGCPGLVNFLGGDAQHFEISQEGAFSRVVPALERAESASDFYDYRSSSSHTGLEHVDRSLMYLYRDLSNPEQNLALFWTHGIKDSRQASAQLWGRMKGMPPGTKIIVQDDAPAEFNWHDHWNWTDGWEKGSLSGSGPYIGGKWTFAKNTDGGAIDSMRTDLNWTIEVDVQFHSGAPDWDWRIYFGDGSEQELDPSKTLVIGYVATANKSADTGPGVTALQVGQDTTFCALPTVTSHSASVLVTFDFGDGTSRDVWVPPGELACAHHSYEKPGSYPVTANATDVRCGGPSYAKQLTTAVVTDASAPPPPPPGPPPSPPPPPPLPPPSYSPTMSPSAGTAPSSAPSSPPSTHPTAAPLPSPSSLPTKPPSSAPSAGPSPAPSTAPSAAPTGNPTPPVSSPSRSPRIYPTAAPQQPSAAPSHSPTTAPAALPTRSPVSGAAPTAEPTAAPAAPTGPPAGRPTKAPAGAVGNPTAAPAGNPTAAPTGNPTAAPAGSLTAAPAGNSTTGGPTAAPVSGPMPSAGPRPSPTSAPAEQQNTTPPSQGPAPAPSPPSAEPAANCGWKALAPQPARNDGGAVPGNRRPVQARQSPHRRRRSEPAGDGRCGLRKNVLQLRLREIAFDARPRAAIVPGRQPFGMHRGLVLR
eukprot:TRINITY_DN27848_c0_g1_i1.p1 TRINITY_DN27848_c0_g1~~TRINITY_DN27848_c0_g1_i1.p1  ORF type:complete len:775 (+),score=89.57 TRINITY_DN27848_c0_g1_i1:34-2325(+)